MVSNIRYHIYISQKKVSCTIINLSIGIGVNSSYRKRTSIFLICQFKTSSVVTNLFKTCWLTMLIEFATRNNRSSTNLETGTQRKILLQQRKVLKYLFVMMQQLFIKRTDLPRKWPVRTFDKKIFGTSRQHLYYFGVWYI